MCVGQIQKCQSSEECHYTLPQLFSIKKFCFFPPTSFSPPKKKKGLRCGEQDGGAQVEKLTPRLGVHAFLSST